MSQSPYEPPEESEQLDQDQFQPQNALIDRGVEDALDEGYSPPEKYSQLIREGEHETLDERLAEEEPEPDPYAEPEPEDNLTVRDELENLDDGEVGDERAGRLMDPNQGIGPDVDKDMIGDDVGIDGGAASAEEAAVHIVSGRPVLTVKPPEATDETVRRNQRDVSACALHAFRREATVVIQRSSRTPRACSTSATDSRSTGRSAATRTGSRPSSCTADPAAA